MAKKIKKKHGKRNKIIIYCNTVQKNDKLRKTIGGVKLPPKRGNKRKKTENYTAVTEKQITGIYGNKRIKIGG